MATEAGGRRQEGEAVRCLEAEISAKPFPSASLFFLVCLFCCCFCFVLFLLYKSDLAPSSIHLERSDSELLETARVSVASKYIASKILKTAIAYILHWLAVGD